MPGLVHIVDDDASFLTAIERRLKQAGYEVATYPSALIIGQLASRKRPELHPTRRADTRLGWSGAAEATGELGSTLPIIFLTGNPDIPPRCGLSRRVRMTS